MPNPPNLLAEYRAFVEERVAEQVARYQRANPNCDLRAAVTVQIEQERERLKRLMDDPDMTPGQVNALRVVLAQYLPLLEKKLKGH